MTSPARSARLFAAVAFTPAERRELAGVAEALRGECAAGRFTGEQLLHITLHFFGQMFLNRLPAIEAAMKRAAETVAPFELATGPAGTFGRAGACVLWLGVSGGFSELRAIQAALEASLITEGFPSENREFRAHITLARDVRLKAGARLDGLPSVHLKAAGITLFESTNASGRLEYVPLLFMPFQPERKDTP